MARKGEKTGSFWLLVHANGSLPTIHRTILTGEHYLRNFSLMEKGQAKIKYLLISSALGFLRAYLLVILLPLSIFGFFVDDSLILTDV